MEGRWVQDRVYGIGWSDEKKYRGGNQEEGTEKHRLYKSATRSQRDLGNGDKRAKNVKERLEVAKRHSVVPFRAKVLGRKAI